MPYNGNGQDEIGNSREQEIELHTMDEAERETASAPLIQHDAGHDASNLQAKDDFHFNAVFVWSLTLSAGVSGLLFGYE